MSVKRWFVLSLLFFLVFVSCGYVIAFHSETVSQYPVATNIVLGVTAISLFSWPVCLARAFQSCMRSKSRR